MNRINYVLEKELYRFYFTSLTNVDRNISNITLFSPIKENNIKSIKYIVQFIKKNKVIQEVTVSFRLFNNYTLIKLNKHIVNKEFNSILYFPEDNFIISKKQKEESCVEITRFENSFFIIKINNQISGFLNFNLNDELINIEAVVKCFVTASDNMNSNNVYFNLKKPSMNKNSFELKLTHEYRISCCKDPYLKKTTFINIGIVKLLYNKFKTVINSISIFPKLITNVEEEGNYYIFKDSKFVY